VPKGPLKFPVFPPRLRLWAVRLFFTTAGTGSELILRFVRTVILAHLLVPAEFGVAIAITLLIFASELASDIGLDRFILNKPKEDLKALATVHALQIGRGILLSFVIVLCASPTARLFDVPQFASSFMLAALPAFIRGFGHLGVKQAQRDYNYRLEAISITSSQLISLTATIAMAYVLRDHRVIIVAFSVEALAFVIMTHRLAPSPFSARADATIARQVLAYGLPLVANGIVLAVMTQADRMLVGHYSGLEALANYAVVLNIAIVPLSTVYRIVASVALAMFARDHERRQLEVSYVLVVWGFSLVGFMYACSMSLGLDVVVPLIFGKAYKVTQSTRLLVSLIVFTRVLRWAPTLSLLTLARTKELTFANMVGGCGIVIAAVIAAFDHDMSSILIGVLVGDIASTAAFQRIVMRQLPPARPSIEKSLLGGVLSALMIFGGTLLLPEASLGSRLQLAALFLIPAGLLAVGLLRSWNHREAVIARGSDGAIELDRTEAADVR